MKSIVIVSCLAFVVPVLAQESGGQRSAPPQQQAPARGGQVSTPAPPASVQRPQVAIRQNQPAPQSVPQAARGTVAPRLPYPPASFYGANGHRYHDGRGWHALIVYQGLWGYWWYDTWYPIYADYYQYQYPYPYPYPYLRLSGLKFDLSDVAKDERSFVREKGVVYVDGVEVGVVKHFEGAWHSALLLSPANHRVSVVLPDGRRFDTTAGVQAGRITHILIRLAVPAPPPGQDK